MNQANLDQIAANTAQTVDFFFRFVAVVMACFIPIVAIAIFKSIKVADKAVDVFAKRKQDQDDDTNG